MMMIGHIKPDMTLTKAEIAADRAAWDDLERKVLMLSAAMKRAADIIDANLYHQREKVEDAGSILRQALRDNT